MSTETYKGKLFYVIGPSGAGKDTLINYARQNIAAGTPVLFAHRYITREVDHTGENHIELSHTEFKVRKAQGLFALDWESHENKYGIGIEINFWMENGMNVVMNGSRGYLEKAVEKYPELRVILISVSEQVLWHRLKSRGRENDQEIEKRIERSREFNDLAIDDNQVIHIKNDSSIEEAGKIFLDAIKSGVMISSVASE
ncbi:MAG: phosphonate metabolism protein/1,5-bisphosphokinase (PRPP-forming) PhnN [Cyclobacteriaceae bacterium]